MPIHRMWVFLQTIYCTNAYCDKVVCTEKDGEDLLADKRGFFKYNMKDVGNQGIAMSLQPQILNSFSLGKGAIFMAFVEFTNFTVFKASK